MWAPKEGKPRDLWREWRGAYAREHQGDALRRRFALAVVMAEGELRTIHERRPRLPMATHYTWRRDTIRGGEERYAALCGVELQGPVDGTYLAVARDHDCAACRKAVEVLVDGALVREM